MPWNQVPAKWKAGELHSGGPKGPLVRNQKQMVAIMLSEKKKAATNPEYAQHGKTNVGLALYQAQVAKRKSKK